MLKHPSKFAGGALPGHGSGVKVCPGRLDWLPGAPKIAIRDVVGDDPGIPGVPSHGETAVSGLSSTTNCVTLGSAETTWATGREEPVARPRYQEGHLRKRGTRNPVWVGCYRDDVITEDGRRLRRQRSVILGRVFELGKRQAQQRLSERLAAINQGRQKPEHLITFQRFVLERWEPNLYPTLRHSTQRNYRWYVRCHLLPFFGEMGLSEIGAVDVQVFISRKSKQIAPKTVVCLRNLLSKIFGTAQRWGYLNANPAQGAQVPALVDTRERITLTPEQVRALLVELAEPHRTMVLLAVLSGLRRGEIFGLRWRYVDMTENSVTVVECSYHGRSAPPKTRASRRKVFLPAIVLEALARLRPERVQPDDFVFPSKTGTALHPGRVRGVLHAACDRAGVPRVGWHTFRYTYATWAEPTGESIKALQAQLGHTDSRVTLGVYTQPMPEAQRRIAAKVTRVLLPIAAELEEEEDGSGSQPVLIH